jgi:hypothetical protein
MVHLLRRKSWVRSSYEQAEPGALPAVERHSSSAVLVGVRLLDR